MSLDFTPHDRSFRKVFEDPGLARQLITNYLPQSVVERLDLSTISPDSETFVDEKLRNRLGDLLFRTRFKEGGDALIYVLLEHKSSPYRWVGLQLMKYMARIWDRELARNQGLQKLPPILPVVFYHGKQDWGVPRNLSELVGFSEEFGRYAPDFDYVLVDCAAIADERLVVDQPVGGVMLIYKHAFDEDFGQHLDRWLEMIEDLVRARTVGEQVLGLFHYLAYLCHNVSGAEFERRIIEAYPEKGEKIMSSVLEEWVERGKKIGREEALPGKRELVLDVIQERFDEVPTEVTNLISDVSDDATLHAMVRVAARAQTVEQLKRGLREARAGA